MSDRHPNPAEPAVSQGTADSSEATPETADAVLIEHEDIPPPPSAAPRRHPERSLAIGLACLLAVVIALAASAPFWAPAMPWGPVRDDAAIEQRLDRLDAALRQVQAPQPAIESLKQAQQQLEQKLGQTQQTAPAAIAAALQPLDKRLAALEAKPAVAAADLDTVRQQVNKLNGTIADLGSRLEALDKSVHARAANDSKDVASVLVLMQIRDAVEAGRPFAAQYDTLAALSRDRPDVGQAIAPMQEASRSGVATRLALAARLRQLAGAISVAPSGTRDSRDWGEAVLDRLRGLVQLRRVDGGGSGGGGNSNADSSPDAAVRRAELAVAGGNLADAVAALAALSGGPAGAAAPWLQMARQRLAVDDALHDTEARLTARLGQAPPPGPVQGSAGSPG